MRSRFEIAAQKELEGEGYLVDYKARPHRTPKGYHVDYFNAFDLLAYRPGHLRWISINASSDGVRKWQRELIEQLELPSGCSKEIWTYGKKSVRKEVVG